MLLVVKRKNTAIGFRIKDIEEATNPDSFPHEDAHHLHCFECGEETAVLTEGHAAYSEVQTDDDGEVVDEQFERGKDVGPDDGELEGFIPVCTQCAHEEMHGQMQETIEMVHSELGMPLR